MGKKICPVANHDPLGSAEEMAKMVQKLTALAVSKIKIPGYHSDGLGLYLAVGGSGCRSWIFRYSINGKRREMGLGSCHVLSLSDARAASRAMRELLIAGVDPLVERGRKRLETRLQRARAITFDKAAVAYIDAHRSSWKSEKHGDQWANTIATYASPLLGDMPVSEIDTRDIVAVLQPIWTTKAETATRVRGRIEAVLDWATVSGYREGPNPARWKGHLEKLLAKVERSKRVVHHPALDWRRVPAFMAELDKQSGIAARALRFCILTAARSGEVRGMRWAELDLDQQLWTVPASRMKAGVEHRVPLSAEAVETLKCLPKGEDTDLVFPAPRSGEVLSDMAMAKLLRRMKRGDITVHGFRSSFRDWAAESSASSFGREAAEHALAHSLPNKVEAAYRRSDLLDRRRGLMAAWGHHCTEKALAEVVQLRATGVAA